MDEIEVPEYFICPISLQIMKDPVTTLTGITYDRESIEHWLTNVKNNPSCPVTKIPLPKENSDLTPNHTLRRLIQGWCVSNASLGIDRIPTPKPVFNKVHALKLVRNLSVSPPHLQLTTLQKLEILVLENERNRKCMMEAGVHKAICSFVTRCYTKDSILGLEEALSILHLLQIPKPEMKLLYLESNLLIESLIWVFGFDYQMDGNNNRAAMKMHSVLILKKIIKIMSTLGQLGFLKPEFFQKVVDLLRSKVNRIPQRGINAALSILSDACSFGRARKMMIDANAVFELVELEMESTSERRTTELVLGVLFHLCSCADGRAELLGHAGGLAMVSKRIQNVSTAADDRAVSILLMICKFSGNDHVVIKEMVKIGAVSKICMVVQSDCATYLKDQAKQFLRSHFDFWKKSPCINVPLLKTCTS